MEYDAIVMGSFFPILSVRMRITANNISAKKTKDNQFIITYSPNHNGIMNWLDINILDIVCNSPIVDNTLNHKEYNNNGINQTYPSIRWIPNI